MKVLSEPGKVQVQGKERWQGKIQVQVMVKWVQTDEKGKVK